MKRTTVRIAAAGDVHCAPQRRDDVRASFAAVAEDADLILLAGDLTTYGEPVDAEILAEATTGTRTGPRS